MNLERDAKRTQLRRMVRIKNKRTPAQQAKLTEIKGKMVGIQQKMHQAQELAQQWKQDGRDVSDLQTQRT